MLGEGDVGLALGFEKMRDAEGKMDGKLIGKVLGLYAHPDERPGKTFVFPHLFAEVMKAYMDEWRRDGGGPRGDRRRGVRRTRVTTPTRRCRRTT